MRDAGMYDEEADVVAGLIAGLMALRDAERAKLRRWQLRLRWRKTEARDAEDPDRLLARKQIFFAHNRSVRTYQWLPIVGPRGVLP